MSSSEDLDKVIHDARRIIRECKAMTAGAERQYREYWRGRAGPIVDLMLQSREKAQACLEHPNPEVRGAALSILADQWEGSSDPSFARSCERIALGDADDEVRSLALTCLGSCYQGTNDRRIGKFLADLIKESLVPEQVKIAAYSSLLALSGELDSKLEVFLDFRYPNDVDWTVVHRFQ